MIISPFIPIRFCSKSPASRYTQTFATTDHIMVQVIAGANEAVPDITLNKYVAGIGWAVTEMEWQQWTPNESTTLYFVEFKNMNTGCYTVSIGDKTSEAFRVTDDRNILGNTTLIQYRFKDNREREDAFFVIDSVPYFFDFRVPGGFKDSGWSFGVNNAQFTTQDEDVVELFAREYTQQSFTMGTSVGVPVWFGELLNRLLTCSYVYFDGKRYARSESETPQINILIEGLESFVFTQSLRRVRYIESEAEVANQIAIRRVDDDYERIDDDTNPNVIIID